MLKSEKLSKDEIENIVQDIDSTKEEVELLSIEERSIDKEDFIKGEKTPVYFGSAMNNFGVIHVLDKLVADAPQPLPRQSIERLVNTDEKKFKQVHTELIKIK